MTTLVLAALLGGSAAQVEFPIIVVEGEAPAPRAHVQEAPTPDPDRVAPLLRSGFRDRLLESAWDL